jgi:hypothetical protein
MFCDCPVACSSLVVSEQPLKIGIRYVACHLKPSYITYHLVRHVRYRWRLCYHVRVKNARTSQEWITPNRPSGYDSELINLDIGLQHFLSLYYPVGNHKANYTLVPFEPIFVSFDR